MRLNTNWWHVRHRLSRNNHQTHHEPKDTSGYEYVRFPLTPAFSLREVCVYRSADFQSAVSPICNRQSVGSVPGAVVPRRLAECNSAIQQTTSLRYERRQHGKHILPPGRGKSTHRAVERREVWIVFRAENGSPSPQGRGLG